MSRKKKNKPVKEAKTEFPNLVTAFTTVSITDLSGMDIVNVTLPEKPNNFAMNIHSVNNIFSKRDKYNLFSDLEETVNSYRNKYGIDRSNNIEKVGIDLNDSQLRVLEGVLKAFKHSAGEGYTGNIPSKDKKDLVREGKYEELPKTYNNITNIPRVRLNQSELFKLTGIKENSIAERERVIQALDNLGTTQHLFYYERLSYNNKGKPEKNEKGKYEKEEVTAIDTLFTVKTVRDNETKTFKYYEIEPTATLLDQAGNYFLLIPYHWREEVKQIMGGKEISSYTMKFLMWLRLQFEEKRRKNYKTFEIKMDWESIAIILNMPETIYKRNKKRANNILLTAYETAVKTGYLKEYSREHIDILILNELKYFTPEKPIKLE